MILSLRGQTQRNFHIQTDQEIDWTKFDFTVENEENGQRLDPLWKIATHYRELKRKQIHCPLELKALRHMAVEGILQRTLRIIRHFRRKTRLERCPWPEAPSGEIALLETFDQLLEQGQIRAEDILVEVRREKPLDLVLMIDTSLSMTGRKLALCAVGAAVLALRLRAESYSIVAFGSVAKVLKPMGVKMSPQEAILTILDASMLGYTDIHAGLIRGQQELRRGRAPMKVGILLTDGKFTSGPDPESAASRYRRLEILMTVDHNMDRQTCCRLASAGHGHITEVRHYGHLPERLLGVLRSIQR